MTKGHEYNGIIDGGFSENRHCSHKYSTLSRKEHVIVLNCLLKYTVHLNKTACESRTDLHVYILSFNYNSFNFARKFLTINKF